MYLRSLSFLLFFSMFLSATDVSAQVSVGVPADFREVRQKVEALSQKGSKVAVELRDRRELKGYISKVGADSFELADLKNSRGHTIAYAEVAGIQKSGLSKGAKTALWIGAAAAGVTILVLTGRPRPGIGPICPLGCGL